ncbi:hypothetical protein KUTeg_021268 [Tegillarca granosa]|uniref:Uncharacterized protein n=1 Tax=Tegillarca granosa TaxID=220873 RepID=A0ABQ9ECY8_TEGGR|nr:hypothetical protein KUTeg_021268 [Tegillarca granosa]
MNDPDAPPVPERGYLDNDTDNKDHTPSRGTTAESTSTLGRIKQKYHLVTEKYNLPGMVTNGTL